MKKTLTTLLGIITILSINVRVINAQQGGPDSYGYTWTDSKDPAPKTTYGWDDDISSTGFNIGTHDDDGEYGPYPIGFTFTFYGQNKTQFYIGNNGAILFNTDNLPATNSTIPTTSAPDPIIAAFWDDLDSAGSIYCETKGTSPNRFLIIQYDNINHKNRQNQYITFQIILFETTNAIKFQYKDVDFNSSFYDKGASATVGIEDNAGDIGLQYSFNTASLEDSMAILFELPDNNSPNVPTLVSPENLFITNDNTPTLTAYYSDPDGDQGQINFQIASDAGFTSILASGNSNQVNSENNASWTPGTSISNGIRYWRAQAEDIHGATSTWSAHRTIIIETVSPITALVTTPADGGNYNQYTMPANFQGKAADNLGGVGLEANSTVFCIRRQSDNRYWDGFSWNFFISWLSTTHNETVSNTEESWNDNATLPVWNNDTYNARARATDKANNTFQGTIINFTFTADLPEINNLTLNPPSPLNGSQNIQVTIYFNEEMDTSVDPTIKFGTTNPYETYTLSTVGVWSQGPGYDIYTTTLTAGEINTAGSENYHFNISGAEDTFGYMMDPDINYTFSIDTNDPGINTLTLNPLSPFNNSQNVQITIEFNEEMDTAVNPLIRFGQNSPYTTYTLSTGSWSQGPGYDIYTTTLTTGEINTAGSGNYHFNISGAEDEIGNTMQVNTAYTFTIDLDDPEITSLTLSPPSPFNGSPNIQVTIYFNEEMDTSVNPLIRFGQNPPYTTYTLSAGSWSQGPGYDIYTTTLTAGEITTAGSGNYHFNISGAKDEAGNTMGINTNYTFVIDTVKPVISSLNLTPPSPFNGTQNINITIYFSKEMNTAIDPLIRFGQNSPYTTYTLSAGSWSQGPGYDIYSTILTAGEINTADTGNYHFNISGAEDETGNVMQVNTGYTFIIDVDKPTINSLTLNPLSPFNGTQNVQITIRFDEEMDTSVNPLIRFGQNSPYTTHTVSTAGSWSQGPGYDIYTTTLTAGEITSADTGNYHFNISGAEDNLNNVMNPNTIYTFIIDLAKPVITSLTLSPPSPFNGSQNIQVTIYFNEEMDVSINPLIRFGKNSPYTTYTLSTAGSWSQGAGYDIYTTTLTAGEITTAGNGTYRFNISQAKDEATNIMNTNTNYSFIVDTDLPSITSLTLEPASPFNGHQNIKITIDFSEEMNTGINPLIRFGQNSPYITYTLNTAGSWSQGDGYDIYITTMTINEINTADSGDYHFNISGARDITNKTMSIDTNNSFKITLVYPINFADELPTSSQWQNSSTVTCRITVVDLTNAAIDTGTIKYRIADSISAFSTPGTWHQNNIECTNTTATTARFSVSITELQEGENNYIKWKCSNIDGTEGISNPYQIKVSANQSPQLNILQPDENAYAGVHPLIQATVSDEGMGIDPDSINIVLSEYLGSNIITVTGSQHPEIYNSNKGLISYLYQNSSLTNGKRYTVTISVRDLGYNQTRETQKSVNFVVKEKAIVDFVPYPSPFDPLKIPLTIRYVLSKNAKVTITIYDVSGKLIKTIIKNEEREAGEHTGDKWVGTDFANQALANGIYFCEIVVENEDGEHRMYKSLALFGK